MRVVKIITGADTDPYITPATPETSKFEKPINEALREIAKNQGKIIKTEYGVSHEGYLKFVIIEYEEY